MLVPINLTGPSSESRAPFLNNQKTQNLYPEVNDKQFILNSFPVVKAFSTGTGADRGMFTHLGILYQVQADSLITIDSAGTRTNRGIITGNARCIFAGIGSNVVIVTNGFVFQWNGTTLTAITDVDLETPNSVAHLNNQVIYDGDGGRWVVSDVGDATSIQGLNYATAESNADDLIRVYVYDQILYLFGDKTIEPWWNSGNGNPPFDRFEVIISVGLGALHSVARNDNRIYFLGDDRQVYILKNTSVQRISDVNIANQIENLSVTSDAEGHTYTFQGQNFYEITFPTANRSFAYSESVGQWFELSSGSTGGRHITSAYVYVFNKCLASDHRNGNIYELNIDTFDEFGDAIIRIRDSDLLSGDQIRASGKELTMNRLELILETGVGTTGQGLDPVVMMQFSDDGGRTFSTEMWATVGKAGDFVWKVEWFDLGSFYYRVLRFKMSDPVLWTIRGANADIVIGL